MNVCDSEGRILISCEEAIKAIMDMKDPATLARWYCELNCWEWPSDLLGKDPIFDQLWLYYHLDDYRRGKIPTRKDVIDILIPMIEKRVSEYAISMYWNCIYTDWVPMTFAEFEDWWREKTTSSIDPELRKKVNLAIKRRISMRFHGALPPANCNYV